MNLGWIDWAIVVGAVIGIRWVSWSTRSAMKSVADFLSANRSAGRYLLTIAGEMGNMGPISLVALWQAFTAAGFPTTWWGFMQLPLGFILVMAGWVYFRLRETRALTVAQFLEMRYSRRFRIFAGFLCWICGILNFGIFPAVAARFLIYFCGLPDQFFIPGVHWAIPTFPVVMAGDLGLALMFVTMGGQISVMVTECVQGMIAGVAYLIISVVVIMTVHWSQAVAALRAAPANASMLHPYHTGQVKDFNVWFYLIGIVGSIYSYNTWLGAQGFMTSARNPHEQRMGAIISVWRRIPVALMNLVLPLGAFTLLHSPQFAEQAAAVHKTLLTIHNPALQNEMQVPIALAHLLPTGAKGLMAMVILFLSFTCNDTYMHSWGSIFVQDVVMPMRKKPFTPEEHIRWLRWSIIGVAVWAFFFSLFYTETDKILFFFAITGTVWLGGAGAVMIGGLYWRRGTTAGAYTSLIVGALVGILGLALPKVWEQLYHKQFPIDGQWLYLIGMVVACLLYFVVSLLTGRADQPFNLDRMLHRGAYAKEQPAAIVAPVAARGMKQRIFEAVGIHSEFSRGDSVFAILLAVWNIGWFAVFVIVTAIHYTLGTSQTWWENFWHFYLWLLLAISGPVVVWFTIGGVIDIRALFKLLQSSERDHTDDGRVIRDPEHFLEPAPDLVAELPLETSGMQPAPFEPEILTSSTLLESSGREDDAGGHRP